MSSHDEHDDDLEPEVIEGAEIEAETYQEAEDADAVSPRPEVPKVSGGIRDKEGSQDSEEEEPKDDASDTV